MAESFHRGEIERRFEYWCACCGEPHSGLPAYHRLKPAAYYSVPDGEVDERAEAGDDICIIRPAANDADGHTQHFIGATLDVPIVGSTDTFPRGVRVDQSAENFRRHVQTYDDQSDGGSFGWPTVDLPGHDTRDEDGCFFNVPCDVHWGGKGLRPHIEVHECDRPLFADQRDGISWDRAIELVERARGGHESRSSGGANAPERQEPRSSRALEGGR